jgi:hypothetical protein
MKWKKWQLGLLSIFGLLSLASSFAPTAVAQCVQADIAVQYNISGSKEPTERTNDVDFASEGACQGNASITTSVQGNEGGRGKVRQTRTVRHQFNNQDRPQEQNSGGSTVQIKSNPAIDVYNAADNLDY